MQDKEREPFVYDAANRMLRSCTPIVNSEVSVAHVCITLFHILPRFPIVGFLFCFDIRCFPTIVAEQFKPTVTCGGGY